MDTRFHCVYLLRSLDPQCVGEYYIGYTVDPLRRLRQHNGELVNGAWRTKRRGRPWELLCCVSGFGEDRIALKFEWCWQHPSKSTRLKAHVALLRGVHRLPYAIGVMHFLLRADLFARLPLTLHIFEPTTVGQVTAELRQRVPGLPQLTETSLFHIEEITRERFQSQYLDEAEKGDDCVYFVTAQTSCSQADVDNNANHATGGKRYLCEEDIFRQHAREKEVLEAGQYPCSLCTLPLRAPYFVRCSRAPFCGLRAHLACLAMWFTFDVMRQRQPAADKSAGRGCGGGGRHDVGGSSGRPPELLSERNHSNSRTGPDSPHHSSDGDVPTQQERASALSPSLTLLPRLPCPCPLCDQPLQWGALVHDLKRRALLERRWAERRRREKMEAALAERLRRIQSGSLAERRRRRGATQVGQKRRRHGACDGGGEEDDPAAGEGGAIATQREDSSDFIFGSDANASSALFSAPLLREEEEEKRSAAASGARRRAGGGQMAGVAGTESITDICDRTLQLTEFNLDEWLDN